MARGVHQGGLENTALSAAAALKAARSAGIKLAIDGEDLALTAPSAPPATVLDALSRHKAEIVALLRPIELWRAAFSRLDPLEPPCPGFQARWWLSIYREVLQFLGDDLARLAVESGWSTVQLFGVHRDVGALRADCVGALLATQRGRRVVECTPSLIRFRNGLAYYGCALPAASIPVWDFRATNTSTREQP